MKLIWREDKETYVVRWREAGKTREKSCNTKLAKEAQRFLGEWRGRLATAPAPQPGTWDALIDKLQTTHYPTLSPKGESAYVTALNAFARIAKPSKLSNITSETLQDFRAKLLTDGKSKATAANYLRHVRAALSFAATMKLLAVAPAMPRAKRGESGQQMKGFAVTRSEFRAWLRSEPHLETRALLILLWTSGLRLGEALSLEWSRGTNRVDLDTIPYPTITLGRQKSGRATTAPVPPVMFRWLRRTPLKARTGRVALVGPRVEAASRLVSASGQASPVRREGKSPTAHDLRRGFGTFWASRLLPQDLRKLMRHSSIATTMRFYVDAEASELGATMYGRTRDRSPT